MEELTGKVKAYQIEKRFDLNSGYVATYVKQGRIIRGDDMLIDLSLPVNRDFYDSLLSKHDPKADQMRATTSKHKLDIEQKQLDIEKRREEIKQLRLKNEKMEGRLIPADLVKDVFRRNGKAITTAFSQALENYLTILSAETKMSSRQVAKMRKQIITTTNEAITEGVKLSLTEIKELVDEFSEKRGKGERK